MSHTIVENRDEMLADFQSCTGIDDYGEAFSYLDSCNWNLADAINKVLPEQPRQEPSRASLMNDHESPSSSYAHSFAVSPDDEEPIDMDSPIDDKPSIIETYTSRINPRISENSNASAKLQTDVIDIHIKIKYEGDDSERCPFPLEIPESTTVGELQTMLHHLLGIPPCRQVLDGFVRPVFPSTVITRDLLPANLSLTLTTNVEAVGLKFKKKDENEALEDNYVLLIRDEKNEIEHCLPYPSTKFIREIKIDIFHLTSIPSRQQVWTGWPSEITENSTLASIGSAKQLQLSVNQIALERTPKLQHKTLRNMGDVSEENSSADEFEDASELPPEDDFLILDDDIPTSQISHPLIPPNTEDEECGVLSFIEEFQNRFGSCTPQFYHGTLEGALKESVMLPPKTRKPLAVYLHHDKSVSVNVFCSQALCHMSVVENLTSNFVVWGWDITHESNKNALLKRVTSTLGMIASTTIKSFNMEKLPALLIINKSRGSLDILTVIHGNKILDEVLTALIQASDFFEEQRSSELVEENRREQRENVKAEQDAAYNASLEVDRAKAIAKRKAELDERVERERQQSIKEQEDALKEAVRASLEMDLPPEPDANCSEPTTVIRFRVPNGEQFVRVFTKATPLQVVMNYLCVKGYPPDEYKYLQSWPRRCITSLSTSQSLDAHNFPAQELVTVEERTEGQSN